MSFRLCLMVDREKTGASIIKKSWPILQPNTLPRVDFVISTVIMSLSPEDWKIAFKPDSMRVIRSTNQQSSLERTSFPDKETWLRIISHASIQRRVAIKASILTSYAWESALDLLTSGKSHSTTSAYGLEDICKPLAVDFTSKDGAVRKLRVFTVFSSSCLSMQTLPRR